MNYRALRDLFHISKARMDAIEYEVQVQMIEIYNEQVRDLLVSDGSNRRYPCEILFPAVVKIIFAYDVHPLARIVNVLNYAHIRYSQQFSA